jgi:hypothetical protein
MITRNLARRLDTATIGNSAPFWHIKGTPNPDYLRG